MKFVDRHRFEHALQQVSVLRPSASFASSAVPVVEFVVGILLVLGSHTSFHLSIAAILFLLFAATSLANRLDDCACGPLVPKRTMPRIVMSVLLAAGCATVAALETEVMIGTRLLAFGSAAVFSMTVNLLIGVRAERTKHHRLRVAVGLAPAPKY